MALTRHSDAVAPVRSSGPLATWFGRHMSCCGGALRRIGRQPFASFLIVLVIGVTLALPAALNLTVRNVAAVSGGWEQALDFSVFLEATVDSDGASMLAELIRQRADVAAVELILADDALAEFRARSGFGEALDLLDSNPLPHTLIVRPSAASTSQSMTLLREELENLPETARVQIDTEWVQRFHAILDILRQAILIGSVLIGAAIVVIVGNTIRLEIQNRRDEIEVTKLIGASNAFVRRPFLWSGFWYGLLGAGLAILMVYTGFNLLEPEVARLASLYQGRVGMLMLTMRDLGALVGIGVALGLTGSWLAAARHMRAIEPR